MTTQLQVPPQCSPEQVTQSLAQYLQAVDRPTDHAARSIRRLLLQHDLTIFVLVAFAVLVWPLLHDTMLRILLYVVMLFATRIAALDQEDVLPTMLRHLRSAKSTHRAGEYTATLKLWVVICVVGIGVIGTFVRSAQVSDNPAARVAPSAALAISVPAGAAAPIVAPQRSPRPAAANSASDPAAQRPPRRIGQRQLVGMMRRHNRLVPATFSAAFMSSQSADRIFSTGMAAKLAQDTVSRSMQRTVSIR